MVTSAPVGSIGPFEFGSEDSDWQSYTERLELYFVANGIEDPEKHRATLLTACGSRMYQLNRDLLAPAKPTTKTFEEHVTLVQDHQQPVPSVNVQRYRFNTRIQLEGETINAFVAQLRKIAQFCQFGDTLNDMLRDRIVCGCLDIKLQRKLLADTSLTYDKAIAAAKAAEAADQGSRDLSSNASAVHKVQVSMNRRRRASSKQDLPLPGPKVQNCYRFGSHHPTTTCKFRISTCHFCKKIGHTAKVCKTKMCSQDSSKSHRTHQLRQEDESDEEYPIHYSSTVRKTKPIVINLKIDGKNTDMEVDTGATLSVMSESTYNLLWPKRGPQLKPSLTKLKTYTGEQITVKGCISVHVVHGTQEADLDILVVAGQGPSLLGRDWLHHFRT